MIFKNAELFNVSEIYPSPLGGYCMRRFPEAVEEHFECVPQAIRMNQSTTGVELRFVMHSDTVTIRMAHKNPEDTTTSTFHVYYGNIQGKWNDHEVDKHIRGEVHDFVIQKPDNLAFLQEATAVSGSDWDPQVVRVIFDRGYLRLMDIIGDIEPPTKEQCPSKTLLTYGSSITHGSNSLDSSHSWPSLLGHCLNMDVRNLGMAGSCAFEKETADYLAVQDWDIITLELGINVLHWPVEKIRPRVEYIIETVAGKNPLKPVIVISPFFCAGGEAKANIWRRIIDDVVDTLALPNVTYINGLDLLGDITLLSADEVHPNIHGVYQIAERLKRYIQLVPGPSKS
ncbi:MAG: hypothetical protein IJ315_04620 [Firmicutes bacterium]|nr:hypothetical protein [Bacillota bacterium]